ncbi:MAG: nicotinate-nucleotide adenylyltransferase [Clostridia bacterium]|nr:nicotinate-nucleotide adenylyltransferase [Clostridia bacterium]
MKRVGIFGGSFDPVHKEHFNMALGAIKELNLDLLYVIPTHKAPHKKGAVASDKDRFNMLLECFKGQTKIVVSPFEIEQKGVSYTYLTITYFKNLYKNADLFFLMGSDMLSSFLTWKNPEIIVKNSHLVLTSRSGENDLDKTAVSQIENKFNIKIERLNYLGEDLSSTKIRVYASLGLDLSDFVLDGVKNYILKGGLYSGNYLYRYINKMNDYGTFR